VIVGSGRCEYHPERMGVGVCVECRRVICLECTTPFEGINRCAPCLAARLAQGDHWVLRREWSVGNVVWAAFSVGAVYCGIYALAAIAAAGR